MKSVSNILAGEFLVDVQHICSTSEDDDVTQLQEYLLRGRGAILLKVLNTIGVQVKKYISLSIHKIWCFTTVLHDERQLYSMPFAVQLMAI